MKQLHPFFSYFGSKYRLAKYYPAPKYDEIIEPFAGSAGYSLMYPDKQVTLYEIYEPIVVLWKWLIEEATPEDILCLPTGEFNKEHPVEVEVEHEAARILMGFWLTESQTHSSRYPLSKSRGGNWSQRKKETIAAQLPAIKHWRVEQCGYEDIPNRKATWHVDPPYEKAGKRYKHNKIDYHSLGEWCKSREGQVMVCEQDDADWLDFVGLPTNSRNASNKDYKELIWYRE